MFNLLQQQEEVEYTRYTYLFTKDITPETVQELIDVLVGIPSVDLFFATNGGCVVSMNTLIHFLNNHPDLNVYLTGYVASAGTFLLTDCTQQVYLSDDLLWILFHQADMEFGGKFRKTPFNKDVEYDQIKEMNDKLAEKFKKLGLSSKEIKDYMKGEDVILYKKDFHRLKINRK